MFREKSAQFARLSSMSDLLIGTPASLLLLDHRPAFVHGGDDSLSALQQAGALLGGRPVLLTGCAGPIFLLKRSLINCLVFPRSSRGGGA